MRFPVLLWIVVFLALVLVPGCGGQAVVPVSGTVTVDGKPHKGLVVSFQPIGDKRNQNPGRGSAAETNESGKFVLQFDGVKPGALVGKHRVRIFTKLGVEPPADDSRESDPVAKGKMNMVETIPPEWHENSEKEFLVPAGGTGDANFAIELKKTRK